MYREVSKLILYRDLGEDSILLNMADIFKRFDSCHYRADELITDIYREMKALLDLATTSVSYTHLTLPTNREV